MNKNRIRGAELDEAANCAEVRYLHGGLYVYAAVISVEVRVRYQGRFCEATRERRYCDREVAGKLLRGQQRA